MFSKQVIALALSIAAAEAAYQGFNYGSTKVDGSYNYEADFKTEFQTAKKLVGTSGGFTSARLYTMIQGGTTNDPIQAIPAAIAEDTSLLLGLWTSGGNVDNEIAALKSAISTYGESFTKLVVGISIGSEDLYRNSVTGAKSNAGVGVNPDELVTYIKQVKSAISGTTLSGASIGHVDTWDAWTNSTNSAVIDEIDWLGFDGYPYYQKTMANGIDQGKTLFDEAVAKTKAVANAKQYWDQVGCPLFGETNTWWYMLADAGASPSFGVTGSTSSTNPLFNLSCNSTSTSSSSASASSSTGSKSGSASSSSVSGFATSSKVGFGVGRSSAHPSQTSTPLIASTQTAASSSGTSSSSSSNSGSSSSGSSSSGSSSGSGSGSSSSSSASATSTTSFNSAARSSGSAFAALAAALVLAIAI